MGYVVGWVWFYVWTCEGLLCLLDFYLRKKTLVGLFGWILELGLEFLGWVSGLGVGYSDGPMLIVSAWVARASVLLCVVWVPVCEWSLHWLRVFCMYFWLNYHLIKIIINCVAVLWCFVLGVVKCLIGVYTDFKSY